MNAWNELDNQLGRAKGLALIFLFVEHPAAVEVLRARTGSVDWLDADELDSLAEEPGTQPLWLDLSEEDGVDWLEELNAQGAQLLEEVTRPLVLVLSAEESEEVRAAAPELWAIRHQALDLGGDLQEMREFALATVRLTRQQGGLPLSIALDALGGVEVELESWEAARACYEESLQICRTLDDAFDLSLSLDQLAALEQSLGNGAAARQYLEESLALARSQQDERDLSVSLDNLGEVEGALGNWTTARRYFEESLEICRRLGDARDLSVSLEKVGDAERALERAETARVYYAESLQLRRQLLAEHGETPQTLHDLALSLERLGEHEEAAQIRQRLGGEP